MGKLILIGNTGESNYKCYLSATNDCRGKVSREHVISHGILKEMDNVFVQGHPIASLGVAQQTHPKALTANILCQKHNSDLSSLDTEALKFYRCAREFQGFEHVDGSILERWFLKVLLGLSHSKWMPDLLTPQGKRPPLTDLSIELLLGKRVWPDGWGLYLLSFGHEPEQVIAGTDFPRLSDSKGVKMAPLMDNQEVLGLGFWLCDFPFFLATSSLSDWMHMVPGGKLFRPVYIEFERNRIITGTVKFLWPHTHSSKGMRLYRKATPVAAEGEE